MRICVPWAAGPVVSLGEVDSTQTQARRLAEGGAPEGTVVRAEHQTRGRGRLGRSWVDEPGAALLVSVVLRPAVDPSRLPQLSLVAGVALAEALAAESGLAVELAWPNDVLVGGRKVAGILAESFGPAEGGRVVILGLGINVNQQRFPPELATRATSLALAAGRPFDRERLLLAVLEQLEAWYRRWGAEGFAPVRAAWCRRSATLGQAVAAGPDVRGAAVDLAEDGALLVRIEAGALVRVVATEPVEGESHALGR